MLGCGDKSFDAVISKERFKNNPSAALGAGIGPGLLDFLSHQPGAGIAGERSLFCSFLLITGLAYKAIPILLRISAIGKNVKLKARPGQYNRTRSPC